MQLKEDQVQDFFEVTVNGSLVLPFRSCITMFINLVLPSFLPERPEKALRITHGALRRSCSHERTVYCVNVLLEH